MCYTLENSKCTNDIIEAKILSGTIWCSPLMNITDGKYDITVKYIPYGVSTDLIRENMMGRHVVRI